MTGLFKCLVDVVGFAGLLATFPGSLELLLTTTGAFRNRRSIVSRSSTKLRLAVVIPAHNEQLLVRSCVESARVSAGSACDCQVVVVADNCDDQTAARAAEAGARVLVRQDMQHRGKGFALRFAFDSLMAEGFDAFLVIDADSQVSSNLVTEIVKHFEGGARALQCRYRVANSDASLRTGLLEVAFLASGVLRPRGRAGWGLSAGLLGNGFALHRNVLEKVPYMADSIVEDLEYHLRLIAASERIEFVDRATVFGDMPEDGTAARQQRSRWEGGRLRMVKEWTPRVALDLLSGNWRFAEPLLDLLTLPLAFHVLVLLPMLLLPMAVWRNYAIAALALVLFHVISALFLGGNPLKSARALAGVPLYVLWKLTTLTSILSTSRKNAAWVRTTRKSEATELGRSL